MDVATDFQALRAELAEIADLGAASALLHWDQETYMPSGSITGRAQALATLAGVIHQRSTASDLRDRVERLRDASRFDALDDDSKAIVRLAHRDIDRSSRIAPELVRALAETTSHGQQAWAKARQDDCFADFAPWLEKLLSLKREVAQSLGYIDHPLDALLEDYEPGATVADLSTLFRALESELKPLVAAVASSGVKPDISPLRRTVPIEAQRAFALEVAGSLGFDFEHGRLDVSSHPFTQKIHDGDVRLTWHFDGDDLRPGLFAVVHEAGHGLYEQNLPKQHARTPLCEAASLGIHESQSRLWENCVARSRSFWQHFLPRLEKHAGSALAGVGLDAMYAAANVVEPSFIRIEADELTYNLHIILRFFLECDLFSGKLAVRDLPTAWNDRMFDLLGIRPPTDRQGVLQDIHWSMGGFGYFPTYTLGNLYAAQWMDAAERAIGPLDEQFARGDLRPLSEWLRSNVHAPGRRYTARELMERVTGKAPDARYFLDYAKRKYGALYRLT